MKQSAASNQPKNQPENLAVAIIPARGGSKRIPHKNIKPFAGLPMIAHSIRTAKESGLFARVIVSTDSSEIAAVAKQYGAEVPFERPAALADDFTPIASVLLHVLEELQQAGERYPLFCCLTATAPLLRVESLKEGFALMSKAGTNAAISVGAYSSPIYRALKMGSSQELQMIWPEHELTRSNDLPAAYYDAAQFYWLKTEAFLKEKRVWLPGAKGVVIPSQFVQDIDTPEDWDRAEFLHHYLASKGL